MKDNNLIATLCSAFGPTLMVIGLSKLTGTSYDIAIAAAGSVSTSYAMLINGIPRKYMTLSKPWEDKKYL
tara:strand:- start:6799 stop:7008 length:210 start_codon:yes stop_codon:yes gene_type:complete